MRRWRALGGALLAVLVVAGALWAVGSYRDQWLTVFGLGRPIVVYYASPEGDRLVAQDRWILPWRDAATASMRLLAAGPRAGSGLLPVIPEGTRPLGVRLEHGVATVDFSREIVERHWGGTTGELLTVYGIVNTLSQLPGVHQVRIEVEGRPLETLAGHVDLTQPLSADPSLVVQGADSTPATGPGTPMGPGS